jgi:transposase
MRFYTGQHPYYCGVDLHARSMYVCILDSTGKKRVHRNLRANPEEFLDAILPYTDGVVGGAECMFTWYWLADLCHDADITFVLGHALYMKAIHGGKAKNDKIDSYKIASLLRGGTFPQAYVYPREWRSTRDLLRRRLYLVRQRGELIAHVQNTHHQYNVPEPTAKLIYQANRKGVEQAFSDQEVQKSVAVDLSIAQH